MSRGMITKLNTRSTFKDSVHVDISSIYDDITNPAAHYKPLIDTIRTTPDKRNRSETKAYLPCYVASARLKPNSLKDVYAYSGYLFIDIDNTPHPHLLRTKAAEHPSTKMAYISPSGNGIHIIVSIAIPDAITKTMFATLYSQVAVAYQNFLGVPVDYLPDHTRKVYFSHDPDAVFNDSPLEFVWNPKQDIDEQHELGDQNWIAQTNFDSIATMADLKGPALQLVEQAEERVFEAKELSRHMTICGQSLSIYTQLVGTNLVSPDLFPDIVQRIASQIQGRDLGPTEVEDIIKWVKNIPLNTANTKYQRISSARSLHAKGVSSEILLEMQNRFAAVDKIVRYNGDNNSWEHLIDGKWRIMTPHDRAQAWQLVWSDQPRNLFNDLMDAWAIDMREYPERERLQEIYSRLPELNDKCERIHKKSCLELLETYMHEHVFKFGNHIPDEYLRWGSRQTILARVQRTFIPGATQDTIPVLTGPEGIGKSRFVRFTAPPDKQRPEAMYVGEVSGSDFEQWDTKKISENLQNRRTVEIYEIKLSAKNQDRMKANVGLSSLNVREAYGRPGDFRLVTWNYIGTANNRDILGFKDGARRFAIYAIEDKRFDTPEDHQQWMADNLEFLEAGAMEVFDDNPDCGQPTEKILRYIQDINEEYTEESPIETVLDKLRYTGWHSATCVTSNVRRLLQEDHRLRDVNRPELWEQLRIRRVEKTKTKKQIYVQGTDRKVQKQWYMFSDAHDAIDPNSKVWCEC